MAEILTEEERRRYSRTIMLDEIGEEGQARICAGSVLIVGCGALGSVGALYLAGAGAGRIGLVDFDTVDESNLQRQIAYTEDDRGCMKALRLAERLKALNSNVEVEVYPKMLDSRNAGEIIGRYDVIVEGSDNPATKHLAARESSLRGKGCIVGGVAGWRGQTVKLPAGCGDLYNSMFGEAVCGSMAPCGGGGVAGPVPGIVGSMQASDALKMLAGADDGKSRVVTIDAFNCEFRSFEL